MNFYSIRHLTRFRYSHPVSESIMETRMHPRTDSNQHCLTFTLSVSPRCRVFTYRDHLGNNVQHFDIPGEHSQLVIIAESVVEQQPLSRRPRLPLSRCLGAPRRTGRSPAITGRCFCPALSPSKLPRSLTSPRNSMSRRRDDPLMLVHELNQRLFDYFEYVPAPYTRRLADR